MRERVGRSWHRHDVRGRPRASARCCHVHIPLQGPWCHTTGSSRAAADDSQLFIFVYSSSVSVSSILLPSACLSTAGQSASFRAGLYCIGCLRSAIQACIVQGDDGAFTNVRCADSCLSPLDKVLKSSEELFLRAIVGYSVGGARPLSTAATTLCPDEGDKVFARSSPQNALLQGKKTRVEALHSPLLSKRLEHSKLYCALTHRSSPRAHGGEP